MDFQRQEYPGAERTMLFCPPEDRFIGMILERGIVRCFQLRRITRVDDRYSGNVMKIGAIRKEDRGTYYCIAENGVGRGSKRNINVEVEFAPVITAPRPRLGQALQYDMDLECHVEAYPPAGIVWLKEDVQLSNNQHYSISHFATADEYTDTTLRVITIEKRQYGDYVCRAANKLGSNETKVELFGKRRTPKKSVHIFFTRT